MTTVDACDPVAAAIAHAVTAAGRRGLSLGDVWAAAEQADPELAWAPGRRARLGAILDELAANGDITWTAAASAMDRTGVPPLPRRLRSSGILPAPKPARPTVPTVWRPELDGIHRLERPRPDELATLHAVNNWLRDRPAGTAIIPLRERSWEIFGDEKRLDKMISSRLFRERVLTLELLAAIAVHPPFVHRRLAPVGDVFICENHQTYHSALSVLADGEPRGFAVVGYGAGNQFPSAVSYVEDLAVGGEVIYFGDLDADGLRIAAAAAVEASRLHIRNVRPATGLYEQLLDSPVAANSPRVAEAVAETLVAWLDPRQRQRAVELLITGRRIPQEALTAAKMSAVSDWR
jgi:hypothetical protein